MSLLNKGRETVVIFPMIQVDDGYGGKTWKPSPTGTAVRASVQPVNSEASDELAVSGQSVETVYRVRTVRHSGAPVGPWARVRWLDRDWDVVGEPDRQNGSETTTHSVFRIRARGL